MTVCGQNNTLNIAEEPKRGTFPFREKQGEGNTQWFLEGDGT